MVFAGSVVRTDYKWADYIENGRVQAILNYVATADWVVAWFPNALQMIGFQDLGGAGHLGFDSDRTKQIKYVKGQHGAALEEDNWDAIAKFVIDGTPVVTPLPIQAQKQASWVSIPGHVAPLIWIIIAATILSIGFLITPDLTQYQWKKLTLFLLYICGIYFALTKL